MKNRLAPLKIAILIWLITSLILTIIVSAFYYINVGVHRLYTIAIALVSLISSTPLLALLVYICVIIKKKNIPLKQKEISLYKYFLYLTLPYGIIGGFVFAKSYNNNYIIDYLQYAFSVCLLLFACALLSSFIIKKQITNFFSQNQNINFMEHSQFSETTVEHFNENNQNKPMEIHNKLLVKGIITALLILAMLIPTAFVNNLVSERETRQQEVAREVTSSWATEQTLSGPYIYIPYSVKEKDEKEKEIIVLKHLYLLPENLSLIGNVSLEERSRSIYKIQLYRSDIKTNGNFKINIPQDIDIASLQLKDAKICYNISDFKGIEQKLNILFNGIEYELSPGLPTKLVETAIPTKNNTEAEIIKKETSSVVMVKGLSASINLSILDFQKPINFSMNLKIKGSNQLHFIPLSGNSNFAISSPWQNPKFDGSNLPSSREVSKKGFKASWAFNNANLPFGTVLKDFNFNTQELAFGVSLLQPTDQYSKTNRSVKYAILFIGLTFALFFIIELLQNKPMHPIQYVLVGLSLVIFFILLLSISEYILFDFAYFIAASATIMLITLYAKSHFKDFATAGIFGTLLGLLYSFIFVLIRLEDSALLIGSIGLFIILGIVMFGSRKINWYNSADKILA